MSVLNLNVMKRESIRSNSERGNRNCRCLISAKDNNTYYISLFICLLFIMSRKGPTRPLHEDPQQREGNESQRREKRLREKRPRKERKIIIPIRTPRQERGKTKLVYGLVKSGPAVKN